MSRILLGLAALLTLLITLAHVFLGGALVVPPLMESADLGEQIAWLLYFCWHDGTVALIVCAIAFAYAALRPGNTALAVFASAIVSGFGVLGMGVALAADGHLWDTPAPYAFGLIGLVGWAGVLTARKA